MESSKRYLLQAEIDFWHEMLRLNRGRLSSEKQAEMRSYIRRAMRQLNAPMEREYRVAA